MWRSTCAPSDREFPPGEDHPLEVTEPLAVASGSKAQPTSLRGSGWLIRILRSKTGTGAVECLTRSLSRAVLYRSCGFVDGRPCHNQNTTHEITQRFHPALGAIAAGLLVSLSLFAGCTGKAGTEAPLAPRIIEKPKPPTAVPMWLGNGERNFFGTGPWKNGDLKVIWEVETGFISGRLHKDPWGGTSWPGQPSIRDDRIFFPSADGNVYCLNKNDGSVIWKFKGKDSMKATPVLVGDKVLASGLDHHLYCLNAHDGSLIWDYQTGFEVDGSTIVDGDRIYFGGEDHNFYCLSLTDGSLIYKILVGSVEGSITLKDGRVYLGTEEGDLFCIDPADGKFIWKAKIGADSDSTPAVANGFVYTAAEDGVVRCYRADTGALVWNFVTDGGRLGQASEHIGIWASPIVVKNRIYIGASNHYLYCLTADKGEVVWKYKAHGPIWGTSPVVDGRVVFGDKGGWINLLSADDGKLISELKIGDNVNSTPAVLDGRIYIGAFNGKLYCLGIDENVAKESATPKASPIIGAHKRGRKR
jgi:eukaryotic-like serine/threonine-protein kinase